MANPEEPHQSGNSQGVSLDRLSEVYARAIAGESKRPAADLAASKSASEEDENARDDGGDLPDQTEEAESEDPVPISPLTVLEAMLFVGSLDNEPLAAARAAELMRGVTPGDVASMVEQLNAKYRSNGCPYKIVGEGAGYRMTLRSVFEPVRRKFYGRVREARLSQAAIDTLAIVAYRQPLTADQVGQLRGTPSGHLLNQLVRRKLLEVDRSAGRRKMLYRTSPRFLELFGLESLEDLPDSQ